MSGEIAAVLDGSSGNRAVRRMRAPRSAQRSSPPPAHEGARIASSVSPLDERALVERIRAGDVDAFESVFAAYYGRLWAMALSYVGAPQVAKECVQDVFIWLWERRDQWQLQGSLAHYLYRAVRNHALNRLRGDRAAERWEQHAAQDPSLSGMSQGPESPDAMVQNGELAGAIARAVAGLPSRQREAFQLRYQHGMSNAGVASIMGVSTKCIEIHLARALRVLRTQLAHLQ